MLKRYIGNTSPARIVVGGGLFTEIVETGDAIVVPDDLANSVAWSEANWESVTPENENKEESDK